TTIVAVRAIHKFASDRLRRAPAWDCGFPNADPATQYTAASFAQPIGRVFGETVFRTREKVDMPAPGALRPARLVLSMRDPIWDAIYARIHGAVDYVSGRLNVLQFLTIRLYLSLVFAVLIALLLAVSIWT
ncbi:MAG: hydrogenase 4 subunit B, partial [Rhodoblastus sp.]|nr:hydrogenase 4 subunit B [Rhodoblastus sp.]